MKHWPLWALAFAASPGWAQTPPEPAAPPQPAAPAPEDPKEAAARFYEEGITLFQTGEYGEAAERFQQAYNFDPAPNLLFNLARALEMAGKKDEAVLHYKAYLARHEGAEDEGAVRDRIAELEGGEASAAAKGAGEGKPKMPPPQRSPEDDYLKGHLLAEGTLFLNLGGAFDTEGLQAGDARLRTADPDLSLGFGLGGAFLYEAYPRVWVGGRLRWSATELDEDLFGLDRVGDTGQVRYLDLSAEARYAVEIERFTVYASTWLGPSWLSGELAVPRIGEGERDASISGSGWHWGVGAGGAYPLGVKMPTGSLALTGLIGVIHHSADMTGELDSVQGDLTADPVSSNQLLLEFGAHWRW